MQSDSLNLESTQPSKRKYLGINFHPEYSKWNKIHAYIHKSDYLPLSICKTWNWLSPLFVTTQGNLLILTSETYSFECKPTAKGEGCILRKNRKVFVLKQKSSCISDYLTHCLMLIVYNNSVWASLGLLWCLSGIETSWQCRNWGFDPLEKEMTPHPSILAWEVPWTEEPGGLQSMESQKSQTCLSS